MTAPELDLAAVKATAEAARAGEWQAKGNHVIAKWTHRDHDVAITTGSLPEGNVLNAKHIATMDPSTTLALVDRLEQAEREVERLRTEVDRLKAEEWSIWDQGAIMAIEQFPDWVDDDADAWRVHENPYGLGNPHRAPKDLS